MGILTQTKDGLRFSGDDMLFQAGSTNGNAPTTLMTLKSDNKLGIGITQPLQRFHVEGVAYFGGGSNVAFQSGGDVQTSTAIVIDKGDKIKVRSGAYLRDLLHQDSTNSIIKIGQSGTSLIAGINLEPGHDGNSTGAQVRVYGGGTEYVRFDGYNKRVGIGVTNPTVKLDVDGDIKATGIVKSTGPVSVNNRSALSVAHWAGSSSSTGAIKITVPGSHSSNWSMFVLRITTYEYNSNNHTVYYVSGHDWTSSWYNYGVTKNGKSNKDIKFGYDSNYDYIILGETNSTWAYGHVTVDVIAHPSFYSSSMDITTGWGISQVTSLSGITTQSVVNRRVVTTKTASGYVGIGTDSPSYGLDIGINPGSGGITTRLTQGNYCVRINGIDLLGYSSDRLWMISNSSNSSFIAATNWDWDTTCEYFYTPGTSGAGQGVLTIGQINKNNANWTHGHTRFKVGGSDRVAITNTGLGIGTNSPSYKLDVLGAGVIQRARTTNSASYAEMHFENDNNQKLVLGSIGSTYSSSAWAGMRYIYSTSGDLAIKSASAIRFYGNTLGTGETARITSTGLGIGTTSPSDGDLNLNDPKLHVVGASTASTYNLVARFQGGNDSDNTGAAIAINHSNDRGLLIRAGRKDSDRPVAYFDLIDSNGSRTNMMTLGEFGTNFRVDIDPNNSLNASSPGPNPNLIARFGGGVTIESGRYLSLDDDYYNHAHMRYNVSGGEARFELLGYYGIDFKTRSTTKMVVKGDNGFVGIGTTSPGTKLHVSDGEIRISNSYGTKDIAQFYNTMTFKGDSNCQFYFGTSQNPSYSTPLPVHTGKLNVTGHIYGGSAVQTITTTSGTINLDAEDYGVFRLTSSLTGTTTLNIQNMKSGQVIDVVLTGDQTVNLTSDDTAETFYRIGETTYDGTATNHLQIVCISDANSAAIYHFTVAKIASSSSI